MIEYRNATLEELTQILEWAADEGWNPGLDDAQAFYSADPDGFFVAVNESGAPIAAISVVSHTRDFAFLGLYIVRPAFRGKGIGLALWNHAIQHAKHRTIGLDGVEAQQENYRASGFAYAGGTTRFTGRVAGQTSPEIRPLRQDDISALIQIEAEASAVAKPAYLQTWLAGSVKRATIVHEEEGSLSGFCTARACCTGTKVGPFIAKDSAIARQLLLHAATIFDDQLTLDVPETSTELIGLCEQLHLEAGFKTARMYRGHTIKTNHPNYAVASLELG